MAVNVLQKTELERVLDYYLVWLNYEKLRVFTKENAIAIITQILKKKKLWTKYQPLITSYNFYFPLPLDLRFNDFQQLRYNIILIDGTINDNLILEIRVKRTNKICFC